MNPARVRRENSLKIVMVKPSNESVSSLMNQLRKRVNSSIFLSNIKRHNFDWDKVCASMDTIEDTQMAVESYQIVPETEDEGKLYLEIYGLFQAMYMQQDAIENITDGLNVETIKPDFKSLAHNPRMTRNRYFGHPTKKGNGKSNPVTYHGIARISMNRNTAEGWTYPNFKTEDINIAQLIAEQDKFMCKSLKIILGDLDAKEKKFVSDFIIKMPTTRELYAVEKLYSWAFSRQGAKEMADMNLRALERFLDSTEAAILERFENIGGIGDVEHDIELSRFCINHLREMLSQEVGHDANKDIEVYVSMLDSLHESILALNKELDKEYPVSTV